MEEYNPEYPPGYFEAVEKYKVDELSADPSPDSAADIWEHLNEWREYKKGYPELCARFGPDSGHVETALEFGAKVTKKFWARLEKAAFNGDRVYFENLLKVLNYDDWPEPEMNGIRAAIRAFRDLFSYSRSQTKDHWPTKQEVRKRAEEILHEAGQPIPVARHWPRIFKQAGLWDLPSVTYGRAHKRKKN